jgi:hypothetical protein
MGHAFQSDLRRWDIVAGLCKSIDARTYVEVGCREGRTTGFVLNECPNLRAIAIDPWCEQSPSDDVTRETYADWNFEKIEAEFWKNCCSCPTANDWSRVHDATCNTQRCKMLRMTSEDAGRNHFECRTLAPSLAGDYQPVASLDVVFIDALHDYESVKHDIELWWPLVRPGGYLCGHDYNHKWPGVMRAVAERFNLMDVCLGPDSMWWVRKPSLEINSEQ